MIEVDVDVSGARLGGLLSLPGAAGGVIVFAHGSGSSRHSPRNRYVADFLLSAGFATLLFDLLTVDEERDRSNVFDIELLADRLADATRWVTAQPGFEDHQVAYFGASTGAAAALRAATLDHPPVAAVVSRGGRPDLAGPHLATVTAPTRLIVGSHDQVVLDLNRQALGQMRCECDLVVVEGATHLFEEPGTLERAAEAARDWFVAHVAATG